MRRRNKYGIFSDQVCDHVQIRGEGADLTLVFDGMPFRIIPRDRVSIAQNLLHRFGDARHFAIYERLILPLEPVLRISRTGKGRLTITAVTIEPRPDSPRYYAIGICLCADQLLQIMKYARWMRP